MSDAQAKQAAIQQQALRLKDEFANLEQMRSILKPLYDEFSQRAAMQFATPVGNYVIRWDDGEKLWNIHTPDGEAKFSAHKQLQSTLQQLVQQKREDLIRDEMLAQSLRLRDEYGDIEEVISWARPVYDQEEKRPELRFDTPLGICRVWWDDSYHRWNVRLPDGTITYAQRGELRGFLSHTRQFLRKGLL